MKESGEVHVYQATHRERCRPYASYLIPIQVGAALSKERLGIQTDCEAEPNISLKNRDYCELTALYWAWKHDGASIKGLCHYRRIFKLTERQILERLSCAEVLVPRSYAYRWSLKEQYLRFHSADDLRVAELCFLSRYPQDFSSYQAVWTQNRMFPYNMFISSGEFFDAYCSWLFPLLLDIEKKRQEKGEARYIGYLAERLFNVYLHATQTRVRECAVEYIDRGRYEPMIHTLSSFKNRLIFAIKTR